MCGFVEDDIVRPGQLIEDAVPLVSSELQKESRTKVTPSLHRKVKFLGRDLLSDDSRTYVVGRMSETDVISVLNESFAIVAQHVASSPDIVTIQLLWAL